MGAETYKIVLQVEDEKQLSELKADIDKDTAALALLQQQFARTADGQKQFASAGLPVAQQIRKTVDEVKRLEAGLKNVGGGGAMHAAQGFLEISRAVEDAQYGYTSKYGHAVQ